MPKTFSNTAARSSDKPSKRNGRPGYASKRGDYAPRPAGEERSRPAKHGDDRVRAPRREGDDRPRSPKRYDSAGKTGGYQGGRGARSDRSDAPKKSFAPDRVLERLESVDASTVETFQTFQEMDLPERLTQQLAKMGAAAPFAIQAATIPAALAGHHVLGRGKTGSGKTIAFGVPLVAKLAAGGNQPRVANKPRALVLAPTRELAEQIDQTLSQLARSVGFYTTTIYGGVPQRKQEVVLQRGVDIVIATPGRLEDLIKQRKLDLSNVEQVVVDEADHMCDLGFIEPVNRILEQTGESQKLLFSATLDAEVSALVRRFMPMPFVYEVPGETDETSDIEHRVLVLDPAQRSAVFHRLVQGSGKSIVFVRTKQTAEALSQSLNEAGVPTARLHGDLNQAQRTRNLERFTKGGARVMIATDVAARGIHVDDVRLVIQLDLPEEYKTYLHRAGRTGRAGRSGIVLSLVPTGRTRKIEGLLQRAERTAEYTSVTTGHPLLEELAGPIAPPPVVDGLDFGDSRFDGINKQAVKKDLRERHMPNKLGAAKDRRFRSR